MGDSAAENEKAFYRSMFLASIGRVVHGDYKQRQRMSNLERARASRGKIIIVDDDESTLELVVELISELPYTTELASSVDAAIAALHARSDTRLVITDLKMPVRDGYELIAYVRSNLRFARIPIIVMTSVPSSSHVTRALKLGASDVLAKPITEDALLARLRRVLDSRVINTLLVTDSDTTASMLSKILQGASMEMVTAESGTRALDMLAECQSHVVISEIALPDMTGLDLVGRIADLTLNIPVLLLSDQFINVREDEVVAGGAHGLIKRPINGRELIRKINCAQLYG